MSLKKVNSCFRLSWRLWIDHTVLKLYLSNTLRAAPVPLGHILQGWDQAEGVVAVITTVTQQESVLLVASSTHQAEVQVDLGGWTQKKEEGWSCPELPKIHTKSAMEQMLNTINCLVLTKLTSRVSLRGLILMAKAWALRWRCFLLNPSSTWMGRCASVRIVTLPIHCSVSAMCENAGLTSWHDLQAHHLGTCTKDLEAFWLLVFSLEKHNKSRVRNSLWNTVILIKGQMLDGLWEASLPSSLMLKQRRESLNTIYQ